ncbi:MAG: MgtC/SapB family protein [Anaerovibrio sp.]|uniref:MgtC/SapB family protein n=1 Tax=Anaerovibrio sp. TaxID=1872532 RepID=UPI0025BD9FBB|nr:MgtC/SapB family protein [Anaerovibrio sp.]MBE6099625.1 MgtC/SapB family protein [Anaerovibrio sp.]MBQ3854936.1 MgtC/SapB family protein [Anaerovibrio sp.]
MELEYDLIILGKLAMSCILGGIIGYERESKNKSAGLRTNVLVCLGSCLIMILSLELYAGVEGKTNADPARLAAQVVSGIGFLGAGAIMKEGLNVTGLTTAACLWVVAGVGLAVGAGHYTGAVATTVFVFGVLALLARLDSFLAIDKHFSVRLIINNKPEALEEVYDVLHRHEVKVRNVKLKAAQRITDGNQLIVAMELLNTKNIPEPIIVSTLNGIPDVLSVELD